MNEKLNILLEAEKRGKLGPESASFLQTARSKGLIPAVEAQTPAAPTPADLYDGPPIEYGAQEALENGITFGFADEVGALGAATGGEIGDFIKGKGNKTFGERFEQYQAARARAKDQYEDDSPVLGVGLDVAGGLLSGGAVAKGAYNAGAGVLNKLFRTAGALSLIHI